MSKHITHSFIKLMALVLWLSSAYGNAASLEQVENFGKNPSNLEMYLYIPDTMSENAPLLVAVHYCTGSGPAFFSGSQFANEAEKYGFPIIYPSVTRASKCFDVASAEALTRDGGSDPVAIMSMVDYVLANYDVNADEIYVTGVSSGAMMTNVLLALYPDVFKAGAAFAGVPYTCFATTDGSEWNGTCSSGNLIQSAELWGDAVRKANPGYTGPWPRIQLWHGTEDVGLHYNNFGEEIKQWTNVHAISDNPVLMDSPESNWTRTRYGDDSEMAPVEAISLQGIPHNLPVNAAEAIRFFGLDSNVPKESDAGRCNWYGTMHPLCLSQTTGWGYEASRSCIGEQTCASLPEPYGVVATEPTPTPEVTPTPTPEVTPTPTPEVTPTPTPEVTPTPTPEVTPTPTPEVTPTPTPEVTPTPTPEVTPTPDDTVSGSCIYTVSSDWGNGFTASITVTNEGASAINDWAVSWSYSGGAKVTNLWSAQLSGSNPYTASSMGWNGTLQPGQSATFGFQGSKPSGAAELPLVTGSICQ